MEKYAIVFAREVVRSREVPANIIKQLRTNQRIKASEVRVIGEEGEQLGIMPLRKALELARERELDLVEMAASAEPPVCRLLDYGKYKYEQTKKERQARKSQKGQAQRDIRVRPKISKHDLDSKIRLVKKLLDEGDKVKVSVFFRGREITHPEIGWRLLQEISKALKDETIVERTTVMEGGLMNIIFSPARDRRPKETKAVKESVDAKTQDS